MSVPDRLAIDLMQSCTPVPADEVLGLIVNQKSSLPILESHFQGAANFGAAHAVIPRCRACRLLFVVWIVQQLQGSDVQVAPVELAVVRRGHLDVAAGDHGLILSDRLSVELVVLPLKLPPENCLAGRRRPKEQNDGRSTRVPNGAHDPTQCFNKPRMLDDQALEGAQRSGLTICPGAILGGGPRQSRENPELVSIDLTT